MKKNIMETKKVNIEFKICCVCCRVSCHVKFWSTEPSTVQPDLLRGLLLSALAMTPSL